MYKFSIAAIFLSVFAAFFYSNPAEADDSTDKITKVQFFVAADDKAGLIEQCKGDQQQLVVFLDYADVGNKVKMTSKVTKVFDSTESMSVGVCKVEVIKAGREPLAFPFIIADKSSIMLGDLCGTYEHEMNGLFQGAGGNPDSIETRSSLIKKFPEGEKMKLGICEITAKIK